MAKRLDDIELRSKEVQDLLGKVPSWLIRNGIVMMLFLLVMLFVLLAGFTNLPKKTFWREAWSSKPLQSVALFSKDFLPENLAKKVSY